MKQMGMNKFRNPQLKLYKLHIYWLNCLVIQSIE